MTVGVILSAAKDLPLAVLAISFAVQTLVAQSPGDLHLRRIQSVPIGALPPVAMLMPASRNHNYLVGRIQAGRLTGSPGDRDAIAAGVDLQWRGGSTIGLTAGHQRAACAVVADCPSHQFFGARARLNAITGGPTFAALVGDASATTTVGTEVGFGYATNAVAGRNGCAVDLGLPISLSMFQKVRVVSFFTPGVAWDVRCPTRGGTPGAATSVVAGAGIGIQQLGLRGLDITFGTQRVMRSGAGIHFGISVTYVKLP